MLFEVGGDQAGPLIGAGGAAVGGLGDGEHIGAAVRQVFQLFAQRQGLGAGFPGVQHGFPGLLVVAGDAVVVEVEAGGKHQPVVAEIPGLVGLDDALLRIHIGDAGGHHLDAPVLLQVVVAVHRGFELAVSCQHFVGGGAGNEFLLALDQHHLDGAMAPLAQVFGGGGAAETGADHHHPAHGLLALGGQGGARDGSKGSAGADAL